MNKTVAYEVQLGVVAEGAKDNSADYDAPVTVLVKQDLSIPEMERVFAENIKSLGCDCVCGVTPVTAKDWEVNQDYYGELQVWEKRKTAFAVHITETLSRTIIVYANDAATACKAAEELCNSGRIDLAAEDFDGRDCFPQRVEEDLITGFGEVFDAEEVL